MTKTTTIPSRKEIRELLLQLKIQPGLLGFRYIEDFVIDFFKNKIDAYDITGWYALEGKRMNKNSANIERGIRTIMHSIQKNTDPERALLINDIFVTDTLSNKHFLHAIANYFRND